MNFCLPCHDQHVPGCRRLHGGSGYGLCQACGKQKPILECPVEPPSVLKNRPPPPAPAGRSFVIVRVDGESMQKALEIAASLQGAPGVTGAEAVPGDADMLIRVARAIQAPKKGTL